jgi:hypothetical protein
VHDCVDAFGRFDHAVQIADVADALLDIQIIERRVPVSIERTDGISRRDKLLAYGLTEKTAAAGYQNLHDRTPDPCAGDCNVGGHESRFTPA